MKLQKTDSELILIESGNINLVSAVICIAFGAALIYFYITSNGIIWMPIAGALLMVAGVWIAGSAQKHEAHLSKSGGSTYVSKKLIGGSSKTKNFNLSDISSVEHTMKIQNVVATNNNHGSAPQRDNRVIATVNLLLKGGEKLEVGNVSRRAESVTTISMGNIGGVNQDFGTPLADEAKTIADFCGVKVKTIDKRDSDDLMAVIDKIKN